MFNRFLQYRLGQKNDQRHRQNTAEGRQNVDRGSITRIFITELGKLRQRSCSGTAGSERDDQIDVRTDPEGEIFPQEKGRYHGKEREKEQAKSGNQIDSPVGKRLSKIQFGDQHTNGQHGRRTHTGSKSGYCCMNRIRESPAKDQEKHTCKDG